MLPERDESVRPTGIVNLARSQYGPSVAGSLDQRHPIHMGMFDWYLPETEIACPSCGETPDGWQGKDGPCALFVWRQGEGCPIAQRADEPLDEVSFQSFCLPERFNFYDWCRNGHLVMVEGRCGDGVWSESIISIP
jgi:hypothetical protein